MESTIIAIGLMSIISVVNVMDALTAYLVVPRPSALDRSKAVRSCTPTNGRSSSDLGSSSVSATGLMLGYLMYRSGLVPRGMAMLGLIGGPLLILSFVLQLFDVYKNGSGPGALLACPRSPGKRRSAIYCAWKGFRLSSPLASPEMAAAS